MGLTVLLGLGLLILYSGVVAYTAWMLTHPPRRTYAFALARGRPGDPTELEDPRPFESWTLRSRSLDLPIWDLPGDAPSGPVIILIHGWGDSRIGALARIPSLLPLASRIIALDLPGHGDAHSTSSIGAREVDDILALLERLGPGIQPVLFGWSHGADIALAAASARPVAAVIAESPYRYASTPARNVLHARGLPWRITLPAALALLNLRHGGRLARARFDRAALAARASCPILILHGDCDDVCPIDDAREIARASGARLAEIPSGRHNDLWTTEHLALQSAAHIRAFLTEALAPHATAR